MNLSIPLSTVRCRIFYIKIYWKYERKKNKWVRIQTHWLLIQTHWLRIRGRVLIRGLNNLPILSTLLIPKRKDIFHELKPPTAHYINSWMLLDMWWKNEMYALRHLFNLTLNIKHIFNSKHDFRENMRETVEKDWSNQSGHYMFYFINNLNL